MLGEIIAAAPELWNERQGVLSFEVASESGTATIRFPCSAAIFPNSPRWAISVAKIPKRVASTRSKALGVPLLLVVDAGGLKNARYLEPLAGLLLERPRPVMAEHRQPFEPDHGADAGLSRTAAAPSATTTTGPMRSTGSAVLDGGGGSRSS